MAITYIGVSGAEAAGTTDIVVDRQSGAQTGDFLVMWGAGPAAVQDFLPNPPGWDVQYNHSYSGGRALFFVYRTISNIGTEPATYSIPKDFQAAAHIMMFRGVDTSNPFCVTDQGFSVGGSSSTNSTSMTSITTNADDAMLIAVTVRNSAGTLTPPSGMTSSGPNPGTTASPRMEGLYGIQATAGSTGSKAISWSFATLGRTGWYMTALRPAPEVTKHFWSSVNILE